MSDLAALREYAHRAAEIVAGATGHSVTCICPRCFNLYMVELARLRRARRER